MSRIALIQMNSTANVLENLNVVKYYCALASEGGAKLVLLPENFAFVGKHENDKLNLAETFGNGLIQDTIADLSQRHHLWIVAGTIPIKSTGKKLRASCITYDNEGYVRARYDKIHLFDVQTSPQESYKESSTIERGEDVVAIDSPIGRLGFSVCYDLRFPELYRKLVTNGAEIFVIPSAFTQATGKAHWEILLRARAIENLSYVVAANEVGTHENGRKTHGHSMVIDPWGTVVCRKNEGIGMIITEINLQRLRSIRKQFPCNAHHVLS